MIAVIADDFTGAAELAGISLRYGLSVQLSLGKVHASNTGVLIVCTDSRSMAVDDALASTNGILNDLLSLRPDFIFKKIDSVLRGHVWEELSLQMSVCGFNKVLVVPANPSLGRTIVDGLYFIDGETITATAFAFDPEFPARNAAVRDLLGSEHVILWKHNLPLPEQGVVVADTATNADVYACAARIDHEWMMAGAGDFYEAILQMSYPVQAAGAFEVNLPHLYVCGTALSQRKTFIDDVSRQLGCVSYIRNTSGENCVAEICAILESQQRAVLAVDSMDGDPASLRTSMARTVAEVVRRTTVKEIFIEGGSTAAAVLKALAIEELSPVAELTRGVVQMKANDLMITVKPGSYELPPAIIALYS